MKQQAMNDQSGNNNNNSNNWLGFSLSPQMKMELSTSSDLHHHNPYRTHQAGHNTATNTTPSSSSAALPTASNFYLSPSHLTNWVGAETAPAFHSPLSVMPLRSDGSLCIMEALSRSQPEGMVPSSSPKLEDFLGGASMEAHEYGSQEREAMALSLDSIYYNNNSNNTGTNNQNGAAESSPHEPSRENNPHPVDLVQHPFRPNHHHHHQQQHYYSGIPCHGMYQTQLGGEESSKDMHTIGQCDPEISTNWMVAAAAAAAAAAMTGSSTNVVEESTGGVSGCVGGGISCGELQSLTLSMSPGSQSSCITAPRQISPTGTDQCVAMETKKRGPGKVAQKQTVHRKSIDTFGQRTSQFRGVTRHRWTGRYEAHLWDNSCKKEGQTRKGRQVYLGGYDMEEKAARAYDLAALKYWGPSTHINFPLENYQAELEEMKKMTRQEYVAHLRRKSSGFSRGASMYRGVTRHHQHGRWQARIGRVAGNKDLYLGTFSTQEEAAEAYDIAAIKFRGVNAVTNFDITRYDVEKIMASNTLLAGELARRNKDTEPNTDHNQQHHHRHHHRAVDYGPSPQINGEINDNPESNTLGDGTGPDWKMALYQSQNPCVDSFDQKPISSGSYRNASFSMSLQDLIGIDNSVSLGAHQALVEHQESVKLGTTTATHFSNPSSLVTSLGSSREGSPDKTGPTNSMLFARPPLASKLINPTSGVGSWFPSQLRPTAISMGHLPVFAAWNDT